MNWQKCPICESLISKHYKCQLCGKIYLSSYLMAFWGGHKDGERKKHGIKHRSAGWVVCPLCGQNLFISSDDCERCGQKFSNIYLQGYWAGYDIGIRKKMEKIRKNNDNE